ncbi:MAG TPA: 50S ribosomal protein L23 [Acidobacteriota bacterium]|nr:50S ribosomal protein L23 [Acidobacteriota bacterium]HMZ80725.1 50S ribosomal protein L23 [Acidobacteriota bacterium]HNB69853.1 50S ribosomal protein L23 [Acidobacteriota bacterium]HND19461.1 50S ribosomal protein L23 [Acidobacteriota bacterium]HNG94229.1 50S ribosomal protein L23 [Acidobacteriota bacterium]
MLTIWDVIKSPVITEKAMDMKEHTTETGQLLTFKVDPRANKIQIKNAVEKIFNVQVAAVRTANFQGKEVRRGRTIGRKSDWKKAFVTLKPGSTISEYMEVI